MVTINNYKHHKQQKSSDTNTKSLPPITGTPGVGVGHEKSVPLLRVGKRKKQKEKQKLLKARI